MIRRYPHAGKLIATGLVALTAIPVATRCKWKYVAGIFGEIVQFTEEPREAFKRAVTNLQCLPERMNPTFSETNHP
jgi:hypothetical protein